MLVWLWSDFKKAFMISLQILQSCSRIFWDLLSLWGNISTPLNLISAVELPPAVHSRNFPLQLSSCQNFKCFNRSNLDMVPKPRSARFHGFPLINARKQAGTDRPQRPVTTEKSLLALLLHDWTLLTAYRMGNQSTFSHHQCTRPNI